MAEPAIIATDLRRTFTVRSGGLLRPKRRTVPAVDGLSLHVDAGERVAFIGPNGAGKSTSIRILTGILEPTSGTAQVLGLTPWRQRLQLAHQISTIFGQRSQLIPDLPAGRSFALMGRIYGLADAEFTRRRDHLCDLLGCAEVLDQPVRHLSLGQRMRCELVASLLHQPRVLFLDEPTIGLDLVAKRVLRELILKLNAEHDLTVLLTSHDVADIESVAERVIIIDHGQSVFDGSVDELRREHLQTRHVRVVFADEQAPPESVDACTLLVATPTELELHVDTSQRRIGDVLNELVAHRTIEDIAISEPALENVIGHIYARGAR